MEHNKKIYSFYLAVAAAFVLFHLYTATFGVISGIGQKAIHLGFILILFFGKGVLDKSRKWALRIVDIILIIASAACIIYVLAISNTLDTRAGITYTEDLLFGYLLIAVLLIAAWRCVGPSLSIIVVIFIAYAFLGKYLPGFLNHAGITPGRFIHLNVLTTEGIFGTALHASSVYIILYIILGSLFNETGVGNYFTSVATAAFGRLTGGPAKVAVIASGLFGSINGSAVANVIGTGTFTIPMMKKAGFSDEFAAAVEASASTGGQIMPPIMGTTAFLAAEILGISYFAFAKAAFIPALLYYFALFVTVDLYARKHNLKGISREKAGSNKGIWRQWYLFTPLVFLVLMLSVFQFTITKAGVYTIAFTVLLVMINKENRLNWERLKQFLLGVAAGAIPVGIACAIVGVIIATVIGSGLSFRMSSMLVYLANGQIMVLLLLTMVVSIILGMGVPTTAAYLVLAVIVAPAMVKLGVQPLAAHLFVFYFGVISNITPPVALAAYAAAGIAKCNPNKAGYRAFRLAISGFLLPFMFVMNPVLLMQGEWYRIILGIISAMFGVYCLSCTMEKYAFKWNISIIEQIILFITAILLIDSRIWTDIVGYGCAAAIILFHYLKDKKNNNRDTHKFDVCGNA